MTPRAFAACLATVSAAVFLLTAVAWVLGVTSGACW